MKYGKLTNINWDYYWECYPQPFKLTIYLWEIHQQEIWDLTILGDGFS